MRILSFLLGLTILFLFVIPHVSYAKSCISSEEVDRLVSSNNNFTFSLYKHLSSANPEDNVFFSGFSISCALSMAYVGAAGNTETQIAKVLDFTLSKEKINKAFHDLLYEINKGGKGYILEIANALWGDKGYNFLHSFLDVIEKYYDGGFYRVDFRGDPEGSRKKINKWVERKTREKIKNLLPPGSITALTRLVITNAIYFKGDWMSPFEKENTQKMPFYTLDNYQIDVSMMYQKEKFEYMEERGKFKLLILPYGDEKLSMVIVLPNRKDGISELEQELTWDMLEDALIRTRKREVNVYIPKFKMEKMYDLVDPLSDMGMTDAFTNRADFSNMEPKKELYITNVIHKAYIDVNEKGTEAAAATGVVIALKAAVPYEPLVFKADHPFLYFIIHNPTGQILFMGKVVDPTK